MDLIIECIIEIFAFAVVEKLLESADARSEWGKWKRQEKCDGDGADPMELHDGM